MERPQESTLHTSKQRRLPPHQVASRNHTDSDPVQLLLEKSEDSKRALNSLLESFPSKDSWEKSPPSSRTTSDSNHLQSSLFKKPQKLTSLDSSRTPTSALSTQRELPLCQRTSNWPEESEVRDLEHLFFLMILRTCVIYFNCPIFKYTYFSIYLKIIISIIKIKSF